MTDDLFAMLQSLRDQPDRWPVVCDWLRDSTDPLLEERGELMANSKSVVSCDGDESVGQPCPIPSENLDVKELVFCPSCQWAMERGWLPWDFAGEGRWSIRAGLLHVTAPLADLRRCLPLMGREIAWVGSVRASDRESCYFGSDDNCYAWFDGLAWAGIREENRWDREDLPGALWSQLDGVKRRTFPSQWKCYDSADLAHADLGRVVLDEAWERLLATAGTH